METFVSGRNTFAVKGGDVLVYRYKGEYYPLLDQDEKEIFVMGEGHKRIKKENVMWIPRLKDPYNTLEMIDYSKEYGDQITMLQFGVYLNYPSTSENNHTGIMAYHSRKLAGERVDKYLADLLSASNEFDEQLIEKGFTWYVNMSGERVYRYPGGGCHIGHVRIIDHIQYGVNAMICFAPFKPMLDTIKLGQILSEFCWALLQSSMGKTFDEAVEWTDNSSVYEKLVLLSSTEIADKVESLLSFDGFNQTNFISETLCVSLSDK